MKSIDTTKEEIRNCVVAVTGSCGFLGSHMVNHLINDRNCTVIALDNLSVGKLEFLNQKAIFEWCDITGSETTIRKIFEKYKVEYVFQYAAAPYIPVSFERPLRVFDINAFGALKVINAAQDAGVKGILQVSSAEIYGHVDGKIKETDEAKPHSTYGASKLAIDTLIQARWKENKTPCIALRLFNCVGENDTIHPYVIPAIIEQVMKGKVVKLGNNSFRDFQYAGDAVKMAVELLEKGQYGEVYNMGSEEGIQIYDLAYMIGRLMGREIEIEVDPTRFRPWDIEHLQSDNTKLYSVIDRRPEVSLKEALIRTIKDFEVL